MVSFLIPTYNKECTALASEISRQLSMENIEAEVIVMDDGSTDMDSIGVNETINSISYCSFIRNDVNIGRARIRNRLASVAKYPLLVFLDSDVFPVDDKFVRRYVDASTDAEVVCGGIQYRTDNPMWVNSLRLRYGVACEAKSANNRGLDPYRSFNTSCFMIRKNVMRMIPFDESIIKYGNEDTLLGRDLMLAGISIVHIDNPVYHDNNDSNEVFLRNTRTAMEGLLNIENKISDYSRIIVTYRKIKKLHLQWMFSLWYVLFRRVMELVLLSNHPSCKVFNLYKFTYFCYLKSKC